MRVIAVAIMVLVTEEDAAVVILTEITERAKQKSIQ